MDTVEEKSNNIIQEGVSRRGNLMFRTKPVITFDKEAFHVTKSLTCCNLTLKSQARRQFNVQASATVKGNGRAR